MFFSRNVTFKRVLSSIMKQIKKESLRMKEPIQVKDDAFEKVVLKSSLPVIVDFWAPWCVPCRMVAPTLEKIAAEKDGKLVVAKVNTDEDYLWAQKYGVQGIPTMLFIANGKIIHRQVGALPEPALRKVVDQFLESLPVAQ
ncbi:MAG TPA: thioredoxin [Anaerolineaceae bacterium]|nr:thioredoxin [Anaerolineaceae bacterium]